MAWQKSPRLSCPLPKFETRREGHGGVVAEGGQAMSESSMVERVARALAAIHFGRKLHAGYCTKEARVAYMANQYWRNHIDDARAAIDAVHANPSASVPNPPPPLAKSPEI